MTPLLNLFGRSPFGALQKHMDQVAACVEQLLGVFHALEKKEYAKIAEMAASISKLEHQADLTKNGIRNHLPKSLFLPVDRGNLLQILSTQDSIADIAEDIATLATLKKLIIPDEFKELFFEFLEKNIEAFKETEKIIKEMNKLLETSFGGAEAEKVCSMVEKVAFKEHEADLIQQKLLQKLFSCEEQISYGSFFLWQRIFEAIAALSNLSENLANKIRMTLELK